jgi:pyruvate/2-oxoglutarate dehydrogenase complex dihydrolipoamide dehydrogenase (E3) component
MYEADARAAGHDVDTLTLPLEENDRALLDGEAEGFLRVHLRRGTDRIVGATLVAEHAGDMISELTVAIVNGVGLGGVGAAIHPYPTQSEVFRRAADIWRRGKLTPRVRRAFSAFFRLFD